ncbi:MAG: T9SS type A sorting domain-containing protein [candidate division Zixibacteria bacterium]|nr:T9SS type A sorting domain-containing protein [candidate division Zixibacteria bacterium]
MDRLYYYPPHPDSNYYTPYAWIDGLIRGSYITSDWWPMTNQRSEIESPINITLSGEFDSELNEGNLDISITAEEQITWQDLKLRIALTEDSIYYQAPNGTLWHNYTMRDMIPTAEGMPIELAEGETIDLNQNFICTSVMDVNFCKLVVWVQADGSDREVLQTAVVRILDLGSVDVRIANIPSEFRLSQNYPNPFNAGTSIEYSIKTESHVVLVVYDILGQEIATLVNKFQTPGHHNITWDGRDNSGNILASGMYFYRITTNGSSKSKRMVLLK